MVSNKTLVFNKVPTGLPIPGETLVVEDRPIDLDAVPKGGLVVEALSFSLDPYLRGRMRDASRASYSAPFAIGDPITSSAVARVLASDSAAF